MITEKIGKPKINKKGQGDLGQLAKSRKNSPLNISAPPGPRWHCFWLQAPWQSLKPSQSMKLSSGYQEITEKRIHNIFISCQYIPAHEICQLRQCFQVFLRFTTYQDHTLVCFIKQNHDWREPYAMAPKKRTTKIIQSPQEHQNLRHKSVKPSRDQ